MNPAIETLNPQLLWKHFNALCDVPHGSKDEAAAGRYVVATAHRLGLPARVDAVGNVVVTKPGTKGKEKAPVTVLQGHLDMVCEANSGSTHDFTKDPLRLKLEGDVVSADGTTLGADNGIGVAAALAVLELTDLSHGPLECLFTIDEETGMTGAAGLDASLLTGRQMLNLDTEEEGSVYIGCAGGMDTVATTKVTLVAPSAGKSAYTLKVTGLRGGHSGLDIHEGRGNALKVLARTLASALQKTGAEIASLDGGSKRNAIPREAFACVYLANADVEAFDAALPGLQGKLRAELGKVDPEVALALAPAQGAPAMVFAAADAKRIVNYLHASLHGMLAMSPYIPGLVQTSTNLAIVETKGEVVTVYMSHRSSVESAKHDVASQIAAQCELGGFEAKPSEGYPGWAPNVASPLLAKAKAVHTALFGKEPEVKAIHAGLECGLLGEKIPGMDIISFGPTIQGAHSPSERVSVRSVAEFWKFLGAVLAAV